MKSDLYENYNVLRGNGQKPHRWRIHILVIIIFSSSPAELYIRSWLPDSLTYFARYLL